MQLRVHLAVEVAAVWQATLQASGAFMVTDTRTCLWLREMWAHLAAG